MRLPVGTNSNLYKRWAAPSYEFRDGIESNYEDYKHYFENKIKEYPFGITDITDDELFFDYKVKCSSGKITDESINTYAYAGKRLIVLGFPTYYPEQNDTKEKLQHKKMLWPWHSPEATLAESINRKYPSYKISDQIKQGRELLRINLKQKVKFKDLTDKVKLSLFQHDSDISSATELPITSDISNHFVGNFRVKPGEQIQLKGWNNNPFTNEPVERKQIPINHWLATMDSLNHIVNIFTNHSSFKGNQVDSTTVQDPLGFLFMNKNKSQSDTDTGVKTKQKDEKQYHILIPGLDFSKLAVNKRNILTGLLVNLYQDITK